MTFELDLERFGKGEKRGRSLLEEREGRLADTDKEKSVSVLVVWCAQPKETLADSN